MNDFLFFASQILNINNLAAGRFNNNFADPSRGGTPEFGTTGCSDSINAKYKKDKVTRSPSYKTTNTNKALSLQYSTVTNS